MKLICEKLASSPACMLGMATLTTNRSKIVTKPASSSTERLSQGARWDGGVGRPEGKKFELILRVRGGNASILKPLLNNYNLTVYAITGSNEVNDANLGTNAPRSGGLPAGTPRATVARRRGLTQRRASPHTWASTRGSRRARRRGPDLVHMAGTGARHRRIG